MIKCFCFLWNSFCLVNDKPLIMNSFSYKVFSVFFLFSILLTSNIVYSQDCSCDRLLFGFLPFEYEYNPSYSDDHWRNRGFFSCVADGNPYKGSGCGVILPIELSYFNAVALENKVELNWITSSEENNDFFTIEKSTNGFDWQVVSEIKGAGNSKQEISYTSYDYLPFNGDTYYRLKQTDFDGQFTYSDIHIVTFNNNSETSFYFYPNPVNDIVTIQGNDINELIILSSMGDIVIQEFFENQQKVQISLGELNKGVYFIKIGEQIKRVVKL